MHIPDGYLSPLFSVGMGSRRFRPGRWRSRRVRTVLNNRTVPLLAIFSAFSFTIMMFNVPVPGGTTAHGVGGTLVAIVLGPVGGGHRGQHGADHPGAVLRRWRHPGHLRQLLQHGRAAAVRRLLRVPADRRPLAAALDPPRLGGRHRRVHRDHRRGDSPSGVELGVQPILFNANGVPLYSPYGLSAAIPAMLLAHMFGASIVEGSSRR